MAGVYWLGQDGNTWVRADGFNNGNAAVWHDQPGNQNQAQFFNGLKSIADPNPRAVLDDSTGGGSGSYSAPTAPAAPSYDPNVLAQYDQSANTIQNSLNRLPGQLDIAHGNINSQYNTQNNELGTQFNSNQGTYNNSSTQNQQTLRTNKNTIADQSSQGLRGLMRTLGAYGAVGSDLMNASQAVSGQASRQNAGAGQTYAQNQQSLDTNWGNYQNDFNNSKKKLDDWRTQQNNSVDSQSLSTKQDLLSRLADIRGQRAAVLGGSYAGGAQTYLDQANALSGQIDALARINPTYTGTTPTYTAPTLQSYVNNADTSTSVVPQDNGGGVINSPYLSLLLGRNQDKKQPIF